LKCTVLVHGGFQNWTQKEKEIQEKNVVVQKWKRSLTGGKGGEVILKGNEIGAINEHKPTW